MSEHKEMDTNIGLQSSSHPTLVHSMSDPNFLFSLPLNGEQKNKKIDHQQWVPVTNKRRRSPNQTQPLLKQTKIDNYWLGPKQHTNRFEALENLDNDQEQEVREPKPPPIFVDGVAQISPLCDKLNDVAKDKYILKIIGTERIKIQPMNKDAYSSIYKALEEKHTQFHTYETKANRAFRVVLKNMHPSSDIGEIKESLSKNGHLARNVYNIKHRGNKKPLPYFFIDLEPKSNNMDIYKIEYLLHQKIKFEAPHTKREIPQCARCQRYGHTKKFCHHYARCVKCAGLHETANCQRKERDRDVLCVLCEGNHPANYKGCEVYKELQSKKYPALRKKQPTYITTQSSQNPGLGSARQPNISYAEIARGKSQQVQFENNLAQSQLNTPQETNDICELKQMMKSLMEQMGTMLNLLTTLVLKMN